MFTRQNIAISFGILLVLIAIFTPAASAQETVELGLSISPENTVVGSNSRWVSVIFHVEDAYENCPYTAADIDPDSITLQVKDNLGYENPIGVKEYDRYEITDTEKDDSDKELVLIYKKTNLFEGLDLTNVKVLTFTASGDFKDGNHFTASYDAKVTHIKSGKSGQGGNGGKGRYNS